MHLHRRPRPTNGDVHQIENQHGSINFLADSIKRTGAALGSAKSDDISPSASHCSFASFSASTSSLHATSYSASAPSPLATASSASTSSRATADSASK